MCVCIFIRLCGRGKAYGNNFVSGKPSVGVLEVNFCKSSQSKFLSRMLIRCAVTRAVETVSAHLQTPLTYRNRKPANYTSVKLAASTPERTHTQTHTQATISDPSLAANLSTAVKKLPVSKNPADKKTTTSFLHSARFQKSSKTCRSLSNPWTCLISTEK